MGEAHVAPADILAFWRDAGPDRWYMPDDAFDAGVCQRFLSLWQRAAAGELSSWEASDDGALALYAGQTTGTLALSDFWTLADGAWSEVTGGLPSARNLYALARDRKSTRLNSSHTMTSRMPSSA